MTRYMKSIQYIQQKMHTSLLKRATRPSNCITAAYWARDFYGNGQSVRFTGSDTSRQNVVAEG